ncbi:MAG: hypothetical protein ACKOSQ_08635 [Planctomycetaceae bacterium]
MPGFTITRIRPSICAVAAVVALWATFPEAHAAGFAASETIFPDTTRAWLSVPDVNAFREKFDASAYGQMMADPAMKDFIDSVRQKVAKGGRQRLDKLGLTLEDLEGLPGGEVAVGAIEVDQGRLATVLLVDTTGHEAEAKALVERIRARLLERKATVVAVPGAPPQLTVYALPDDPKDDTVPKNRRVAFANAPPALIVGDDAQQVGQALGVLAQGRKDSLASVPAFAGVMEPCRAALPAAAPPLRWFLDPLKFAKGWQVMQAPREKKKKKGPDYVAILGRHGFDAVSGIGGLVAFSEGAHGVRHHTMIFAPPLPGREPQAEDCYDDAARMLRFPNMVDPRPAPWVPPAVTGWSTVHWDMQTAFVAAEPLVDDIIGDKGVYDDVIASLREDVDGPQIDVEKDFVNVLTGRVTLVTDHAEPAGDPDAERLLFAIEAADDRQVAETVAKVMNADSDMRQVEINGHVAWELIDRTAELPKLDIDIPGAVVKPAAMGLVIGIVHGIRRRARIREKRDDKLLPHATVSVAFGHLFIASHRDILEQVLTDRDAGDALGAAADFSAVMAEVDQLLPGQQSSCSFFREEDALRPAYELLRQGSMPKSKSAFGQLLNALLPEFELVRRYLGTAGLAMESRPTGWYIAGMSLPRPKPDAGVAQKPDTGSVDR